MSPATSSKPRDVAGIEFRPPVAETARGRSLEVLLVRPRAHVHLLRVAEHGRLPGKAREGTNLRQNVLRRVDELLVANLVIAPGADAPTELPCRLDLRSPQVREIRHRGRVPPGLRHDPGRHLEIGRRSIAPVTYEVEEERLGEEPLEQWEVLHVHRRLVAPAGFPASGGVRFVDGGDRLARWTFRAGAGRGQPPGRPPTRGACRCGAGRLRSRRLPPDRGGGRPAAG